MMGIALNIITKTMRQSKDNIQMTKNENVGTIFNINNNSGLCQQKWTFA